MPRTSQHFVFLRLLFYSISQFTKSNDNFSSIDGWIGWLGFNGILSTQVAAIMPEEV